MIKSFRSKALKRFWNKDDASGLNPAWVGKIERQLDALNAAAEPADMDLPSFRFHPLKGDRKGDYAISVSGNWRLTFSFDGTDAINVDLEDYHGD